MKELNKENRIYQRTHGVKHGVKVHKSIFLNTGHLKLDISKSAYLRFRFSMTVIFKINLDTGHQLAQFNLEELGEFLAYLVK